MTQRKSSIDSKSQRSSNLRQRLMSLRQTLGYNQREMAQELGVVQGAIALWESGKRPVPGPISKLIQLYEESLGMLPETAKPKRVLTQIKTSGLTRSLKLSSNLASQLIPLLVVSLHSALGSSLSNSIQIKSQERIARQIVETVGELKGFMLKLGQTLSYLDCGLPESVREIFETLQDRSPPLSSAAVIDLFLRDFKKTPFQLFAEWSPLPFAAASIGQVHRARLKSGEIVAVKVQYPQILKILEADLKGIRWFDHLLSLVFQGTQRGELHEELRERFLEECDYRKEFKNQEKFIELFAHRQDIYIPKLFAEFSSSSILTMEWVKAHSFKEFAQSATQREKNRAGQTLFEFAMESIFQHHCFNGDPHPGNYLFQKGKVVFLDFGCVKNYSTSFVEDWKEEHWALDRGETQKIDETFLKRGLVTHPQKLDFEYNRHMLRALHEPWLSRQPFQFSPEYVQNNWKVCVIHNVNKFTMRIPRELLIAARLQWGLYSVLAALRAQFDCRKIVMKLLTR